MQQKIEIKVSIKEALRQLIDEMKWLQCEEWKLFCIGMSNVDKKDYWTFHLLNPDTLQREIIYINMYK